MLVVFELSQLSTILHLKYHAPFLRAWGAEEELFLGSEFQVVQKATFLRVFVLEEMLSKTMHKEENRNHDIVLAKEQGFLHLRDLV